MRDLLVAVPSRGRPQNVAHLWESMQRTCRGDTTLLVGVDADDPALPEYMALDLPGVEIEVNRQGLRLVVAVLNFLVVPRAADYRFIGHIGDDQLCRTEGWDLRIIQTLSEPNTYFCFGDDLYPGRPTGTLCCHFFMRSEVVGSLGYMSPPDGPRHMYCDPLIMAWGQALGAIRFLPDVILEHMHYSAGKSKHDAVYAESLAGTAADLDLFNSYMNSGRFNQDIAKIRGGATGWDEESRARFKRELNIPETRP